MAPMVQVTLRLKGDGLRVGLRQLAANSSRLPDYLANKACKFIAKRAAADMPRVPVSRMDEELNTAVALVKAKRGNRFLRGLKFQRGNRVFGNLGPDRAYKPEYANVPLLALIVQAQSNPESRFNQLTGSVHARAASPFKGVSRAEGRQRMLDAMRRVLNARHSSGGFFKLCALAVQYGFDYAIRRLPKSFSRMGAQEFGGVDMDLAASGNVSKKLGKVAGVTPAQNGSGRAAFWVATTEADTKGTPGGSLQRVIEPVWQRAVDAEVESIRRQIAADYTATIRASGFKVV